MLQYDLQAQDAVAALRLVCGSRPAFFASATVPSPDGQPQRTTAELARVRRFLPVHLKRFTQDAKVRSRFVKDSRLVAGVLELNLSPFRSFLANTHVSCGVLRPPRAERGRGPLRDISSVQGIARHHVHKV